MRGVCNKFACNEYDSDGAHSEADARRSGAAMAAAAMAAAAAAADEEQNGAKK
jgi:hypothetical protein